MSEHPALKKNCFITICTHDNAGEDKGKLEVEEDFSVESARDSPRRSIFFFKNQESKMNEVRKRRRKTKLDRAGFIALLLIVPGEVITTFYRTEWEKCGVVREKLLKFLWKSNVMPKDASTGQHILVRGTNVESVINKTEDLVIPSENATCSVTRNFSPTILVLEMSTSGDGPEGQGWALA